ncbi:MAG: thioredoxin domain-containing protein [Gemmatimonadaceae bacterium]
MARSVRDLILTALIAATLAACAAGDNKPPAGNRTTTTTTAAAVPAPVVQVPASSPTLPSAERSARRVILNGLDLTGVGYDQGSPSAPIVMVEFSDFACPYCGSYARQTLPALEREFIATGKVFYKAIPIVMGFPNGDRAARAAECAADQGKFWTMHDRLFAGQKEWRNIRDPAPVYTGYAKELGFNAASLAACLTDGRTNSRTQRATYIAHTLGIRATPTFVINGQGIEGALPLEIFRQILTEHPAK